VTQQAVERVLGKLLTDEEFRERFFVGPAEACWQAGLPVSLVELEALARLSRDELARFGASLDQRISRACLDPTWRERANPLDGVTSEEAL
jgi:ribosomally synthesized peptide